MPFYLALALLLLAPASGPGREMTGPGIGSEVGGGTPIEERPIPEEGRNHPEGSQSLAEPGQNLRVALLTMGQGDYVWEKFSHNAILIQDDSAGWARAYNWGIFSFGQVDFIPRLIRGTMLYKMAPFDAVRALEAYRQDNRAVWIQELALTPRQRADLLAFVEWNALPENRDYRYDYYRDNCSTRVRDALDRVLGGALRRATESDTTAHTYRWHTRRLLRTVPAAYAGIQLVLGPSADRPLTVWEEMFLPMRVMEEVRKVEVPGPNGEMRPLVAAERQLLTTDRPPIPKSPPFALPWFLLAGLAWGGGILFLARRDRTTRGGGGQQGWVPRGGLVLLAGGWALVAALCGVLLLGAWLFTDHVFWYRNLNLLQVNPLFLVLLPPFALYLFKGRFPLWGRNSAVALAVGAGVGFLVWAIPGIGQENGEILALTLPVNLALGLSAVWLARGSKVSASGKEEGGRHEESSRAEPAATGSSGDGPGG